jgi:hypothetical protein
MIALVTRDVFFASKITGTAAMLGLKAVTVASVEQLATVTEKITSLILDLGSGIAPADVLVALPPGVGSRTLAFGAHVDVAALEAAKAAGFCTVLPRSRFSAELPQRLRELAMGEARG